MVKYRVVLYLCSIRYGRYGGVSSLSSIKRTVLGHFSFIDLSRTILRECKVARTVLYMYDDDVTRTSHAVLRSTNPIVHTIAEVRLTPTPRPTVFAKFIGLSMLKASSRRVGCSIGIFVFPDPRPQVGSLRWVGGPPVVSLWFASGSANPIATAYAL